MTIINADVAIVGAGAGGATLGAELAQAGAKVVFIEAGKDLDITYDSSNHFASSQEFLDGIGLFWHEEYEGREWKTDMGECAGGGTTTYGGVLEESIPKDYEHWPISYDEFLPYINLTKKRYRTNRWPLGELSDYARILVDAGGTGMLGPIQSAFNREPYWDEYGVYHDRCRKCRMCLLGCKFNAKASALTIALPKAKHYGATVESNCLATRLNVIGNRVDSLTYIQRTPTGPGMETILHKTIYADKFILAAGSMMTPMLLYWSGIAGQPLCNSSGQVGKNLKAHFFQVTTGVLERDDVRTYQGNVVELNDLYQNYDNGYLLEFNMVSPPGYMGGMLTIFKKEDLKNMIGLNFKRLMRKFGKMAVSAPLARSDELGYTNNSIGPHPWKLNKYALPLPLVKLEPNAQEAAWVEAAVNHAKQIMINAGCSPSSLITGSVDSVHKIGTCRMGTSASNSVVDLKGKAWDMDNLWICDGSIFPASLMANCAFVIYSLAYKIADGMLNRPTPTE